MENLAFQSDDPITRNLMYTSGLAHQISCLYNVYEDMPFLFRTVSQYARRIAAVGIPDARTQTNQLTDLIIPITDLATVLLMQILENKNVSALFASCQPEHIEALFANLEQAIAVRGNNPHVPLERLLGLLRICRAVETAALSAGAARITGSAKEDLRKGLMWLQRAWEYHDKEAGLALGYLKLYGPQSFKNMPADVHQGLKILKTLTQQGYTKAHMILSNWYYHEKKDHKEALGHVRHVIEEDKTDGFCRLLALKIYLDQPSLIPADDKGKFLNNLCEEIQENEAPLVRTAQFFQGVLATTRYPKLMLLEEISKKFREVVTFGNDEILFREIGDYCNAHSFETKLLRWADEKMATVQEADKKLLDPVYTFLGWWYKVLGNTAYARDIKGLGRGEKEYGIARRCFEAADIVSDGKSVHVPCLLLQFLLERQDLTDQEKVTQGKKPFDKLCELAGKGMLTDRERVTAKKLQIVYLSKVRAVAQAPKK